jgi:hypothetical protein
MSGNVNVFTATASDNTGSAFSSVQNNIKKTKRESDKLNGSLRMMRGGFGQLGHQVQDVAVQLQMGQNPLMVLTQQGSQVASLFGPTGAVIGAVGAVAGALAGAFIPQLMESSSKTDELHEKVKNLSSLMKKDAKTGAVEYAGALAKVVAVSEGAAENLRLTAIDQAGKRLTDLRSSLVATVGEFDDVTIASVGSVNAIVGAHERLGLTKKQYDQLDDSLKSLDINSHASREGVMGLLNELQKSQSAIGSIDPDFKALVDSFSQSHTEISTLQQELLDFSQIGGPQAETAVEDLTSKFDSFVNSLTRSVQKAEGLTPAQMLGIQLQNMEGLTQAEIDLASALIRRLRAQELASKRAKDAAKIDSEAEKARRERERELQRGVSAEIKDTKALDAERQRNEQKLEGMRTGFLSELELISQQENQRLTFVKGLDDSFFDATRTREDMITMIERDSALQRMRIAEEEQEKKQKIAEAGHAVIQNGLQLMASGFKEGTAIQKAAFVAYKAYAASQAIVSAEVAAANALAFLPPPGNIAFSKFIRGMGYASAAMIMAQTVASFEGGGFTGRGARSGGMDGRGGFLAMLHPNERITDMHNGGGSGITIINNVDARGAGPEVDQKIRAAMQETGRRTVQTVRDLASRGRLV